MNNTELAALAANRLFEDPQEENLLCIAGARQLERFLQKGKAKKSFAVLSDRRFYLMHSSYRVLGGRIRKEKGSQWIDTLGLRRVSIITRQSSWLLALCFFFLLLAPVMVLLDLIADIGEYTALTPLLDAVVSLLLAAVCFLLYSSSKQRLLTVAGKEGVFAIDSQNLLKQEEEALIRSLRSCIAKNRSQ